MLRSLFAGVTGLQSHQVAMDVESNNIANVNTIGYKYSRANFSDLLAQTGQIATAPQGDLGGKNAVQVGLGTSVGSITRIMTQGSIQNTDKNTDVAIQGDGFFIVSSDGGSTYKYSRSGDFKFDAGGNFVDNNGFIVQGWIRDPETGKVDATAPITNIVIPPGLTTPANPSSEVVLKANLNSGPLVYNYSPAYRVPSNSSAIVPPAIDSNGNPIASGDMGVMFNETGNALSLQNGQGVWIGFEPAVTTPIGAATAGNGQTLDITFTLDDGNTVSIVTTSPTTAIAQTALQNAATFAAAINARTSTTGVSAAVDATGQIVLTNTNSNANASHNINFTLGAGDDSGIAAPSATVAITTAYQYLYSPNSPDLAAGNNPKRFTTIADLRTAMENQAAADQGVVPGNPLAPTISVNEQGKLAISNSSGVLPMDIKVTAFKVGVSENTYFTRSMEAMNAVLPANSTGQVLSQSFNAATHSSSIDIFDSLGSKHTLRMEFRKTALDKATGSTWSVTLTVPEPGTIDTVAPLNEKVGSLRFNNDGSLATFNPPSVSFTGNNGSAPDQPVRLVFGTANAFDGMTSFDAKSSTSGISQDGFPGGDIVGIRIDQSGTLIGSFSNGRSFGLAQIGMAKFTNNEGLVSDGSNVYLQSANSGDPIIGTAATAGRGFMQSSALEASNVDLSKSLTNLIIIQRGYQANGKTITTSDTLLETLLGIKR